MTGRSGFRVSLCLLLLLGAGCSLERSGLSPVDGSTPPPLDARVDGDVTPDPDGGCTPSSELCNGVDDDCDPATPDGADEPTLGDTCDGDDGDLCADGAIACVGGALVCEDDGDQPDEIEICNGLDDDCDPSTADGTADPMFGAACDGDDVDLCSDGMQVCVDGALTCDDGPGMGADLCNGVDDDCDPSTPDGSGDPGVGVPCDGPDSDLCQEGTTRCAGGAIVCGDATGDTLDLCNGADDDCNPGTADGSADPGVGVACDGADSDLCQEGTTSCTAGAVVCGDTTGDTLDVCNGIDDDCDPSTADGAGDPAVGVACDGADADMCVEGSTVCSGGSVSCGDTTGDNAETCNAVDDDCDGVIDEGAGCPCTRVTRGGNSYLFCDTGFARSFVQAYTFCRARGYELVRIEDAAENVFVATEAAAISTSDWWIGATDWMSPAWYWWGRAAVVTYDNWRPGQPSGNGDCAELDPDESVMGTLGSWNDISCSESKPFVCEAYP